MIDAVSMDARKMASGAEKEIERLRWQCRRGMLELDLLLNRFLESAYADLSVQQRTDFVRLLGASIETELSVGDRRFVHTMVSDRAPQFSVGERAEIHFDLNHAWVIPS